MKNERLYLDNWNYNAALILQHMEKVITDNGGRICGQYSSSFFTNIISNRTLSGAIRDCRKLLERLEALERTEAAAARRAELERLEAIKNDPIPVNYSTYIGFILDGVYYEYSMDRNPFFNFYFRKIQVDENNSYSGDYYLENAKKEWLYDCFFRFDCSDADRLEAANMIYNDLLNAPFTEKAPRATRRTRVYNLYDGGYHYENIPVSRHERKTTLLIRTEAAENV